MAKYKLEYIWLDGKKPIPELRGKTHIKAFDKRLRPWPICPFGVLTAARRCRPRARAPTAF